MSILMLDPAELRQRRIKQSWIYFSKSELLKSEKA